jgi:hypothetical protein
MSSDFERNQEGQKRRTLNAAEDSEKHLHLASLVFSVSSLFLLQLHHQLLSGTIYSFARELHTSKKVGIYCVRNLSSITSTELLPFLHTL